MGGLQSGEALGGGAIVVLALVGVTAGIWRRRARGRAGRTEVVEVGVHHRPLPLAGGNIQLAARTPRPERLGRYALVQRLGEGGMAEVFAAVEPGRRSRPPVVVKRVRGDVADRAAALAQLAAEAELGAALSHANIVATLERAEHAGELFVAQEYVSGRDVGCLTRRMVERRDRPLSAAAILHIAHEVLGALEHAHDRTGADGKPLAIVHCDVSPENILLTESGAVKLLDFGIARSAATQPEQPGSEAIRGNVDFMAPEQAVGRAVDRRADLFSLGMVMYFCAARAPLYRGKTLADRVLRAVSGPGSAELAFVEGLPSPLPEIVPRLLAVDPAARCQTAAELRALIAPHAAGGAEEVAATVRRLFGAELAAERQRLATAVSRRAPRATASPPRV